jgi:hypothetical protein
MLLLLFFQFLIILNNAGLLNSYNSDSNSKESSLYGSFYSFLLCFIFYNIHVICCYLEREIMRSKNQEDELILIVSESGTNSADCYTSPTTTNCLFIDSYYIMLYYVI